MASHRGRIAPAIWGPWISAEVGLWGGGYTLDIDAEILYEHLYSSITNQGGGYTLDIDAEILYEHLYSSITNHADIADSYYPIVLEYARRRSGWEAESNTARILHVPVHVPVPVPLCLGLCL